MVRYGYSEQKSVHDRFDSCMHYSLPDEGNGDRGQMCGLYHALTLIQKAKSVTESVE